MSVRRKSFTNPRFICEIKYGENVLRNFCFLNRGHQHNRKNPDLTGTNWSCGCSMWMQTQTGKSAWRREVTNGNDKWQWVLERLWIWESHLKPNSNGSNLTRPKNQQHILIDCQLRKVSVYCMLGSPRISVISIQGISSNKLSLLEERGRKPHMEGVSSKFQLWA